MKEEQYFCDRCKAPCEYDNKNEDGIAFCKRFRGLASFRDWYPKDICNDCYKSFTEWYNSGVSATPKLTWKEWLFGY